MTVYGICGHHYSSVLQQKILRTTPLPLPLSDVVKCCEYHGRNNQHHALICTTPLFIYWLLHVLAVVCLHQEASWIHLSYLKYRSNR
jgi:hypothetical protein